jgi:prepilin-type N-terminal cleavage/methylation domain-containing protein
MKNNVLRWVRRSTGFTLIELLVVVGIIGILAGMLLPTLATAREKARRASCLANLKGIGTAVQMYADDHEGAMPQSEYAVLTRYHLWIGDYEDPSWNGYKGFGKLIEFGYVQPRIFYCPSIKHPIMTGVNDPEEGAQNCGVIGKHARCLYGFRTVQEDGLPTRLADCQKPHAIASDWWFLLWSLTGHQTHDDGMNVVYTDGGAKYVKALPGLINTITSNGWAYLDANH